MGTEKISCRGVIISIQPRIRLTRSFDQRTHNYLGYVLTIRGNVGTEARDFTVAIGEAAHEKHQLRAGDHVSGESEPVADPRLEPAELYKAAKLEVTERGPLANTSPPPWHGVPPTLEVYQ